MDVSKLQEGLKTRRFGKSILFTHVVESTNDWAKELALLGAPEGTVAIAETQTRGRGRFGRVWFSPVGGLWFSVILRPKLRANEAARLVFVASLAVAEALHETCGLLVETKWPNDVLMNGRKVCGILSEVKTQNEKVSFVVIGIGLNVGFKVERNLPKELWDRVASLEDEVGKKIQLDVVFKIVLEKFELFYEMLLEFGFTRVWEIWKRYASYLGKMVEVTDGSERVSGLAVDVKHDGSLSVRSAEGSIKHFVVGDVSLKSLS